MNPLAVIKDDNAQYLVLAIAWFFSSPSFWTLPQFMIFSLFHILAYMRSSILPAMGYSPKSWLSTRIKTFFNSSNESFMRVAASTEFAYLFILVTDMFRHRLRKYSVLKCAFYVLFIKVRYEQSLYTRTIVRNLEIQIDGLCNHPMCPIMVRNVWLVFKDKVRVYLGGSFVPPVVPQRGQ